jgi:hypothetical protein
MKQRIFTLIMMLALVIVAGSAMGRNEKTVFQGGTYDYRLRGISSVTAASISATIAPNTNITFSALSPLSIPAAYSNGDLDFSVKFGDETTAEPTGSHTLTVVINNGTCSNSINFVINVIAPPTYTLTIVASALDGCQTRTAVGDNTPNVTVLATDEPNTFAYTITPTITGPTGAYTYHYHISLPAGTGLNSFSDGSGSVAAYSSGVVTHNVLAAGSPVADVFTVTFNSTTNLAAQDLVSALTLSGSTMNLAAVDGGGIYTATMTVGGSISATERVEEVPAIGSFQ